MLSRRAIVAALAALPFARPTAAATIPDIHQLQPYSIQTEERFGAIKEAIVFFEGVDQAALRGKTFGFYGTPLVCTRGGDLTSIASYAFFEEINL